jgi:hypothetical protein
MKCGETTGATFALDQSGRRDLNPRPPEPHFSSHSPSFRASCVSLRAISTHPTHTRVGAGCAAKFREKFREALRAGRPESEMLLVREHGFYVLVRLPDRHGISRDDTPASCAVTALLHVAR